MIKKFIFTFFVSLLFLSALPTIAHPTGASEKFKQSANAIPNSYIVVYEDGKSVSARMSEKDARRLANNQSVKYVEEDSRITATSTEAAAWGLDRIDQRALPLDGSYKPTRSGAGVNVYVIDSGIRYSQSDFGGRAVPAFDSVGDGQNGNDCYGHGTHVAGIVGGASFGVARNATLHSVRILNCSGSGSVSDLISAIEFVAQNHISPAVANISIVGSGISPSLDLAIEYAVASGVTVVVGAGNSGSDACQISPAHVSSAITVGASAENDQVPNWSNRGACVDIFAPGQTILSDSFASDTGTALMSGTSMASPHVAGACALYLEEHKSASPQEVTNAVLSKATSGILTGNLADSPNKLLYALAPMPTAGTARVLGRILIGNLSPAAAARFSVQILNTSTHETKTAFINQDGIYEFDDLTVGDVYVLAVRAKGYQFEPQIINLTADTEIDLSGVFVGKFYAGAVFSIFKINSLYLLK